MQDLYVPVDLTQWLTFGQPFSTGPSAIHFTDGANSDFPGFLVVRTLSDGTSPTTFDANLGFTAPDALKFTGDALVSGIIDGEAVPAPSPGALTFVGAAVIAWFGALRVRRRSSA